ncbi:hypothetical protein COB64_02120 [Candidatus Wolfebacteria bacterium]|nr:MAG: hypothetical protein COB64_02120 [Candidatus Wolfebacteria bacterium]
MQSHIDISKNTKVVINPRVSSKEQRETGYSLPAQEKLLKEYCVRKEFVVQKTFSVTETASKQKERKQFSEMLRYMKNKNTKTLVMEKVDRFTRNFRDAVTIDDWLNEDDERQVHFVKDSIVLHKNSRSQEKLNWGMRIVLAKNYTDNLSEEVKKGQMEKIAQGWLPTKPPLGYKTTGDKGHKIHIINEGKAPFIKEMFELYATGNYSIKELLRTMHSKGLRNRNGGKVSKSRAHHLLSDPFYYGKMRWKGEIYDGKHKPLIHKELFEVVQEKLKRKTSIPQFRKHVPIFKAKINCGICMKVVTWEIQKGRWYGGCKNCKSKMSKVKKYIRQEELETQLFQIFDNVALHNMRLLEWLNTTLKEDHIGEIECTRKRKEEINENLERIENRLEIMYEDKLDGKITPEFYARKSKEYKEEKENILASLHTLGVDNTQYYEAGIAIHELASSATEIYQNKNVSTEEKRLLLSYIFSNSSLNAGKLTPNYTLAFEFLCEWVPRLNRILELEKGLHNKALSQNAPLNASLLRR